MTGIGRTSLAASAGLTLLLAAQDPLSAQGPSAESDRWPAVTVAVPEVYQSLGSTTIDLYGVATAEIHVFADSRDGVVRRLYWVQFEEFNPDTDRTYDYSYEPWRVEMAGWEFHAGPNMYPRSNLTEATEGSDSRAVAELVQSAGLQLPEEIGRVRFVALDETRRKELMIIYLESLSDLGTSIEALEESRMDQAALAEEMRDRGIRGLQLR